MIPCTVSANFGVMNVKRKRVFAWLLFVILLIANFLSYYFKSESHSILLGSEDLKKPIIIGLVDSLTGSEATFGIETANGLRLAFDEINHNGGIHGRPIQLVTVDDQGKPEDSATGAKRLITIEHALAILGTSSSQRTLVIAPMAQSFGVPLIVPGATHPSITRIGDHVFRVCFIDDFQGEFMAKIAVDNLKAKRIAVLTDVKSDYSVGLTDWFEKSAKTKGAQIVVQQSYTAGDLDYRSQLTSIRAHHPDILYVPGYYTDVGLIIRQARDLKIGVPILGGDGWDSPRLIEIAGKGIGSVFFSNHFVSSGNTSKVVSSFVYRYQKLYNRLPGSAAGLAYDSALVLLDAMSRASPLDRSTLNESLKTVNNIDGVTGKISIGPDRNAVKEAIVVSVRNGEFVRAW